MPVHGQGRDREDRTVASPYQQFCGVADDAGVDPSSFIKMPATTARGSSSTPQQVTSGSPKETQGTLVSG